MKKSFLVLATAMAIVATAASSQAQDQSVKRDTQQTQTQDTTQNLGRKEAKNPQDTTSDKMGKKDAVDNSAQDTTTKMLGNKDSMDPTKDIVSNASQSADYTILVSAVKAAGLVDTLKSEGPFTVFAPSNDAFNKLPEGTIDTTSIAGKTKLADIIRYHVVPGNLSSRDLALAISRGNGKATLTTVSGETLVVSINADKNLQITDEKGDIALVTKFDVTQSNGVIHAINNVLLPEK